MNKGGLIFMAYILSRASEAGSPTNRRSDETRTRDPLVRQQVD